MHEIRTVDGDVAAQGEPMAGLIVPMVRCEPGSENVRRILSKIRLGHRRVELKLVEPLKPKYSKNEKQGKRDRRRNEYRSKTTKSVGKK
jgi:hypothetical protein